VKNNIDLRKSILRAPKIQTDIYLEGIILIKKIDITDLKMSEEILSIQIPSYRVEAEIIECDNIPPLYDTIESLQKCKETFLGYYIQDELVGAVSFKMKDTVLDIHRLIVSPNHFRKGIANRLLEFIECHYQGIQTIIVSTGAKNEPAVNLYLKKGFTKVGEIRVSEQLTIASFQKMVKNGSRN
jgi:ribosomal protein S18 acetylase RimI-like enzyme